MSNTKSNVTHSDSVENPALIQFQRMTGFSLEQAKKTISSLGIRQIPSSPKPIVQSTSPDYFSSALDLLDGTSYASRHLPEIPEDIPETMSISEVNHSLKLFSSFIRRVEEKKHSFERSLCKAHNRELLICSNCEKQKGCHLCLSGVVQ